MKHLFVIIGLFMFLKSYSQERTTQNLFSLNLLSPSAEIEIAISPISTLDLNAGFGFAYHNSSYSEESYGFYPGLEAQYRYYYNFEKRADKGRKTSENSANYVAGVASITSGKPIVGNLEYAEEFGGFVGPAWGLQRVYDSGFKLNMNLGLGLGYKNSEEISLRPLFGLQLGWAIIK